MIRITTLAAALALPTLAFAQTVSFTPPKALAAGNVMTEVETQDMVMGMAVTLPDGQSMKMDTSENSLSEVRYEILAVAEGVVTSMKVTVSKDTKTSAQGERAQTEESPLQGTTFVLTQTDAGVEVKDESGNPLDATLVEAAKGDYAKFLGMSADKANKFAKVFEKDAYSIGDTITIEGEKAAKLFADDPNEQKEMQDASLVMTLKAVEKVEGQEIAVFDAVMKMGGAPEPGMKLSTEMSGTIEIVVENSNLHRMKLSGPMSLSANKDGMTMDGKGTMTMETKRSYGG